MSNPKLSNPKSDPIKTDLDLALKSKDLFLDAMDRLVKYLDAGAKINAEEFMLWEAQMRKIPGYVIVYLKRLSVYARTKPATTS